MSVGVQTDFTTTGNANIVTFARLLARFDVLQGTYPLCYVFQPCRDDETIIAEGKKKGRWEVEKVKKVAQEAMNTVVFRHYEVKAESVQEKNNKRAAEHIRRLANEELPEMKVAVNYSESKIAESDG